MHDTVRLLGSNGASASNGGVGAGGGAGAAYASPGVLLRRWGAGLNTSSNGASARRTVAAVTSAVMLLLMVVVLLSSPSNPHRRPHATSKGEDGSTPLDASEEEDDPYRDEAERLSGQDSTTLSTNHPPAPGSGADDSSTPSGNAVNTYPEKECEQLSRRRERPGVNKGVPVQYVHVPKAGGTTIQDAFAAWGHAKGLHVYLHDGDHEGVWMCPDALVNRGILLGHRGFGFCQRMQRAYGDKAFYVVAMREPVSRLRSLFDYFMSHNYPFFQKYHALWRNKELNDIVIDYNKTLHENLPRTDPRMRGPTMLRGLSLQQTAFLCGWDCVAGEANNVTRKEAFQRAVDNLQRADAIVIMEKLDDLIVQMRFHTTWVPSNINKFPFDNTHKGKKSVLSAQAQEIVRQWSRDDVKLYRMAVARHDELTSNAKRCLGVSDAGDAGGGGA